MVLSACSTEKGRIITGEVVANFARAFQYAGLRSVLASLSNVASKLVVEFMKTYLLLAPEAPNVRVVKDQTYKWEFMMEKEG